MKKILKLFSVKREDLKLENKWWHRLFTVFIIASGILVLILAACLTIGSYNLKWVVYGDKPLAFSLDPNYEKVVGKELPCESVIDNSASRLSFIIKCNGVNLSHEDSQRYQTLYDAASKYLEQQFGLDKYNSMSCSSSVNPTPTPEGTLNDQFNKIWGITPEQIACVRKAIADESSDPAYPKYQNALKNIARVKVSENSNMGAVFFDILLWIIIPIFALLAWILFWNSVVYRLILYVIFGKKPTK